MDELTPLRSDYDSVFVTPFQFELLAAEIRSNIYRCLFPDLHSSFKITLCIKFPKDFLDAAIGPECGRHIDEGIQSRRRSFYGGEEANHQLEPQLQAALSLAAVSRLVRGEVVPKIYSNLVLRSPSEYLLLDTLDSLTPSAKQQLQRLTLSEEPSLDLYWKERCCKTFAGLAALREIMIETDCLASPRNTAYRPYMLQWVRDVRRAVPQLTYSHFLDKDGEDSYVRLSASGAAQPFEVTTDVDLEFENWLDAMWERWIG